MSYPCWTLCVMKFESGEAKSQNSHLGGDRYSGDGSVSAIESAPSLRFSIVAKVISDVCVRCGLEVPGFKSPPRSADLDRTVRRERSGSVVAVRIKDRPFEAVIADMVEGVILCNDLPVVKAGQLRNIMWSAVIQTEGQLESTSKHKRTVVVHRPVPADNIEAA